MKASDIIPDEIQHELLVLRDDLSNSIWRVGDIANSLIASMPSSDLGKMSIYSAVGLFVGKASRTIREYAQISKLFPEPVRVAYDVLSFDHFRTAARFGDKRDEILEWAVNDGADQYGRPATVDAIVANFANSKEVGEDYVQEFKVKANAFVASLNPLLDTPLKDKAMLVKSNILDLIDDCQIVLERLI